MSGFSRRYADAVMVNAAIASSVAAQDAALANRADPTAGAGKVGFNHALNYVGGTLGAAMQDDPVHVAWFLSEAQSEDVKARTLALDLTVEMNAAHAFGGGRPVFYSAGSYRFTTLAGMVAGGILGEGKTATILHSTDTTAANLITYTGALGSYSNISTFRSFTLQGQYPTKAAGAGIAFVPVAGESSYMHFSDVGFVACPIGIDFVKASLWKVVNCDFLSCGVAGIQVQNTNVTDSGDSLITGCVFNDPGTTGSAILHKSSGGLKVIGNKMLGGGYGYQLAYDSAIGLTGLLILANNSIEDMALGGVYLGRATGVQQWRGAMVWDNQFGGILANIATDANAFIVDSSFCGNKIIAKGGGTAYGIRLRNVTNVFVAGNLIRGTGGVSTGIEVADSTYVRVGKNYFQDLTTALAQSGNTNFHAVIDSQSGSSVSSAAGWSALGSVFIGAAVAVVFPVPFLAVPSVTDITFTPGSNNGALAGVVTAISATGFSYQPLSAVTGIAATLYWQAGGLV